MVKQTYRKADYSPELGCDWTAEVSTAATARHYERYAYTTILSERRTYRQKTPMVSDVLNGRVRVLTFVKELRLTSVDRGLVSTL